MSQTNTAQHRLPALQRILVRLIEDVRFYQYAFIFAGTIMVFATAYYFLTPISHGIACGGTPIAGLSFWDAAYFSVVTISSLGYGDMHPVGVAKCLAGIQVVLGLLFMGIMLAKLTSFRLAYHVSRLYAGELQKRLVEFASGFHNYELALQKITGELNEAFRETPGQPPPADDPGLIKRFGELLTVFYSTCSDFYEYILQESHRGAFFDNVPKATLARVAENLDKDVYLLGQLIFGLSLRARSIVMDRHNRRRTLEVAKMVSSLCDHVDTNAKDKDIKDHFLKLDGNCTLIPKGIVMTPVIVAAMEQPDQLPEAVDEPDTSGTPNRGEK